MNQKSLEPPHSKRAHERVNRSFKQRLMNKANRREKRSKHRQELRRVRLCWKALAKHPAKPSLVQERILADTYINETTDKCTPQTKADRNQPDPIPEPEPTGQIQRTGNKKLQIGTFNVQNMNFISAMQQIIYIMQKHQLDILALLETHVNYTGIVHCGSFIFIFPAVLKTTSETRPKMNLEDTMPQ